VLRTVGFEKDAAGRDLTRGEYVEKEWAAYGMVVKAKGGYGDKPRLFDCANPGTVDAGDPDLGSPNETCDLDGPGEGIGGEKGAKGENCVPLGFALIVQEKNKRLDIPDDNEKGGVIIFEYTRSGGTYVKEIQLLDIDYGGAEIMVGYYKAENFLKRKSYKADDLGDNSVQTILIDQDNVAWLKVKLLESGAVPSITFCAS